MNKQTFKNKLSELGINQLELARDLGITQQAISKWIKLNKYPPWLDKYFKGQIAIKKLDSLKDILKDI